jgi:hypothetical protein
MLDYILYPKIMIKLNKNLKNVSGKDAASLHPPFPEDWP